MHKLVEAAIADYKMINRGDHVVVGLSGGKDSVMLLKLLARKKIKTTNDFKLSSVFVKNGFSNDDKISQYLRPLSEDLNINFYEIDKSLEESMRREKRRACYLCSRNRRLSIFDLADKIGANVVAFGHHRDDFIQTFMMNLFYNGSIETMKANNPFFHGKYRIIRPMIYINESSISAEIERGEIQTFDSNCPFKSVSERKFIREILNAVYKRRPISRKNIFKALFTPKTDFLLKKPSEKI